MEVNLDPKLLEGYFAIVNEMTEAKQIAIWLKLSGFEWPEELGEAPTRVKYNRAIRVPEMDLMNPDMAFLYGDFRHYVQAIRDRIVLNVDIKSCLKAYNMLFMSAEVFEEQWKTLQGV